MSNLLDKASIILTPTAYNNGEALCVKPSDGSGDFDFSRNSAATRVNAQGLVENVQSLGSEEIVNGSFDENVNGWVTNNANATFVWQSDKTALLTSTSFGYARVSPSLNLNAAVYKVSFDILSFEGTLSNVHIGLGSTGNVITTTGSYTYFYTSTGGSTEFQIRPNSGGTGSIKIDNVSVKEVIDNTNLPRINYEGFSYDGSGNVVPDSGCGSWLFEPQSTNLITQSEALSTMQIQSTVTDNVLKSPTGNVNASIVVENTALNTHGIQRATIIPTNPSATSYTLSIFAKKKERQYIQLGFFTDGVMQSSSGFDLENGTTTGDANTHKIKDFGNGWYRCSFTKDVVQSGGYNFARVAIGTSLSSFYYTGDGASGLYMFGYQLEQGNISSYIPTFGSSVTRNQDVCTNGGSLANINSTEGVLYAEIAALSDDLSGRQISLNNGTTDDRIQMYFTTPSNRVSIFYKSQSGATAFILNHTLTDITQFNKLAFKWKENDFALWSNGTKVATQTSGVTSIANTLTKLDFQQFNGTNKFKGKTKAVAVWKEALSDAELTELTTI